MNLSWNASTDDVGVIGYRLYRNGKVVDNLIAGTSYIDTGLAPGTYRYQATAVDAAGNESAKSNVASVSLRRKGNGS